MADLTGYLASPTIPPQVQQLADTGHAAYQSGQITATPWAVTGDEDPWPLAASGAGRPSDWVEKTFGQSEYVLRTQLATIPPPRTCSCAQISKAIKAKVDTATVPAPMFTIVQGVGVNDLHRTPLGQNCVLQVASQFDFQESKGAYDTPVSKYLADYTQGPQAAIEAAAAALHRKAAKDKGTLPHALKTILDSCKVQGIDGNEQNILAKYKGLYKDGYLQLAAITDPKDKALLQQHIHNNLDKLSVLPQWAQCESTGAMQMQVFCAAPSFQGQATPALGTPEYKICEDLVVAQYVAPAQLAVIRSRETGETVPMHLTMVGQGAFNNNPEVMKKAMEAVAEVVKGENVAVYVHAYDASAQEKLKTQMASGIREGKFQAQTMTAEQFKSAPNPAVHATALDVSPPILQEITPPKPIVSNPVASQLSPGIPSTLLPSGVFYTASSDLDRAIDNVRGMLTSENLVQFNAQIAKGPGITRAHTTAEGYMAYANNIKEATKLLSSIEDPNIQEAMRSINTAAAQFIAAIPGHTGVDVPSIPPTVAAQQQELMQQIRGQLAQLQEILSDEQYQQQMAIMNRNYAEIESSSPDRMISFLQWQKDKLDKQLQVLLASQQSSVAADVQPTPVVATVNQTTPGEKHAEASSWVKDFFASEVLHDSVKIDNLPTASYKSGHKFSREEVSVYHNHDDSVTVQSDNPDNTASVAKMATLINEVKKVAGPVTVDIKSGSLKEIADLCEKIKKDKDIAVTFSPEVIAQLKAIKTPAEDQARAEALLKEYASEVLQKPSAAAADLAARMQKLNAVTPSATTLQGIPEPGVKTTQLPSGPQLTDLVQGSTAKPVAPSQKVPPPQITPKGGAPSSHV